MAAVLCHLLWSRRNAFVFKDQFMSPETITAMAQAEVSVLREVNSKVSSRLEGGGSAAVAGRQWQLPEWPAVKVNFDAAFDKSLNRGAIGIVVRDCEGKLKACLTTSRDQVFSAAQAEKAALQRALDMCIDMDLNHVVFEGDAKAIIEAVNSRNEDFSWGGQETDDLQHVMRLHPGWKLSFALRSANGAAHNAACLAIKESNERVWIESGPLAVMNSVLSDVPIVVAS
ncbi:uncharacterized protein LOC122291013 [Carya illinoinensis]|uniref:uncharacterized protein LOC122291013 n=1 Tax=Carya illinoinensis TaxID=32201 RepID=UPI001C727DC6|nr:uncharacterized protein LOC122291013 [Carya illinoinensis]